MSNTQMQRPALLTSAPLAAQRTRRRWRHPFDTATGTIASGVLLTILLVLALRLLGG